MTLFNRISSFGICNFWLLVGATTHIGLKAMRMVNPKDKQIWDQTKADYVECMKMIFNK